MGEVWGIPSDMNRVRRVFLVAAIAMIALASSSIMLAQAPDDQMLLHPPAGSWPGYHGDYSGRRHSSLNQITPQNVGSLALAWAFQTSQGAHIGNRGVAMYRGSLFFSEPDAHLVSLNAKDGTVK